MLTQSALHRIAMDVAKFFHELRTIPNVEIEFPHSSSPLKPKQALVGHPSV